MWRSGEGLGFRKPGDLFQERPGLVAEGVVLAEADFGGVHGEAAGDVGVAPSEDDLAVAVLVAGAIVEEELDFGGPALVELRGTVLAEHFEIEAVGVAGGNPGDFEATGAAFERCIEGGVVVVVYGLKGVADRRVIVAHDGAEGHGALVDDCAQAPAADGRDVPAQELGDVGEVASDVGQRSGSGPALVAPAHGGGRAESVVGPIAPAEVQHLAEDPCTDQVADIGDARCTAEREADARDAGGVAGRFRHGAGVLERVAQWLLAEDMLPRGQESLDHLAVERIRDDDADDVDVVRFCDRLPRGVMAFIAESPGSEGPELRVHIADRHEAHRRKHWAVEGRRCAVCRRVCLAGHSCADDGDP